MEYYGLEGFGKLCTNQQTYNVFYSRINHYTLFPAYLYKAGFVERVLITTFLYQKFLSVEKK